MVVIRNTDRLRALLTNKGIYIVRSGPPSIENIEFHVHYSSYVEAVPMLESKHPYLSYRFIYLILKSKTSVQVICGFKSVKVSSMEFLQIGYPQKSFPEKRSNLYFG